MRTGDHVALLNACRTRAIVRPSGQPSSVVRAATGLPAPHERGYAMAALLVAMSVMAILMSAAMPAWQTAARREKEAELIFRGEQYARAIALFQQKYGSASPPSIDILVTERLLRKKYKDPITGGDFALITPATALPGRSTPAALQGVGSGRQTTSGRSGRTSTGSSSSGSGRSGSARGTTSRSRGGVAQTTPGRTGTQAGATGGIMGVMSKSTDKSLRVYKGSEHYNEWIFMGTQASNRAGAPSGSQTPGAGTGIGPQESGRGGRGRGTAQRGGRGRGTSAPPSRGRGRFGQ